MNTKPGLSKGGPPDPDPRLYDSVYETSETGDVKYEGSGFMVVLIQH